MQNIPEDIYLFLAAKTQQLHKFMLGLTETLSISQQRAFMVKKVNGAASGEISPSGSVGGVILFPVQHWCGDTLSLILGCPHWTSEPFLLWGWLSTATECPRTLWLFHPWRYSKAVLIWSWEAGYRWLSWSKAFKRDDLNSSENLWTKIQWCHTASHYCSSSSEISEGFSYIVM